MKKHRVEIYKSHWHLTATILFILAPFLFLLIFSRLAHVAAGELFWNTAVSLLRIAVAYLIAAALGWLLAVSFYRGRRALVALPIFDVLQSFPTFAALPLATFFWGQTNFTVIFFLVLAIIWPVFFSVMSSLRLIRRDWEEAVEIAGVSGWDYLRLFLWPASVTGLVTGSIIGLGDGWEVLVATEIIVGIRHGLGGFFQFFSQNPTITALGIIGFLIIIFSLNKLIWIPLLDWSHRTMGE